MLAATMQEPFTEMLRGGHHNSLGRTGEVVELVLTDRARFDELFAGRGEPDELVCMRLSRDRRKSVAKRAARATWRTYPADGPRPRH